MAVEGAEVTCLRGAVLGGEWEVAREALVRLEVACKGAGVEDFTPLNAASAAYAVLVQKFLELLHGDRTREALACLQKELTPAAACVVAAVRAEEATEEALVAQRGAARNAAAAGARLPQLPSLPQLALCFATAGGATLPASPAARVLGWAGPAAPGREALLQLLRAMLPPRLLLPERRLEALLERHLEVQRATHSWVPAAKFSLLTDPQDSAALIPTVTAQVLDAHSDEVWHVQFSHDGTMLATASKDASVAIWDVKSSVEVVLRHRLTEIEESVEGAEEAGSDGRDSPGASGASGGGRRGRRGMAPVVPLQPPGSNKGSPVTYVAWSPDDTRILTCGNDRKQSYLVKMWDVRTGALLRAFERHTDHVTAVAWMPDGSKFFSGGLDNRMIRWAADGDAEEIQDHMRVNDLALSANGALLVSITGESEVNVQRLATKRTATHDFERAEASCTSLCLSADGRYLLLNLSSGEVVMYDLNEAADDRLSEPVRRFRGQKQGRYIIRSCFGGSEQALVCSGSEDSQVYVWSRCTGELLEVLPGHAGTVNAVAWNPRDPYMLASASDDRTVRIWSTRDKVRDAMNAKGKAQLVA